MASIRYGCAVGVNCVSSEIAKSVAITVVWGSPMVFIISILLARACSLAKWCSRVLFCGVPDSCPRVCVCVS